MTHRGAPRISSDRTLDPGLDSWVESANGHPDFPIQNLPLGVFEPVSGSHGNGSGLRGGIRIGEEILDLRALSGSGLLTGAAQAAAKATATSGLNELFGMGDGPRRALRRQVSALLARGAERQDAIAPLLCPVGQAAMSLPAVIGDYTDFYAGIHHASKVGAAFRPDQPLLPNYKWVPVGYHGRASTVRVSGGPVRRPLGQIKPPEHAIPSYAPTQRLDFELELGVWIAAGSTQGQPIPVGTAGEHVAGYCLLNDWSARDVQAWEYQPLGPFLSKNFATTVSGWVVTPEALAPFRVPLPARPAGDPEPLPYLRDAEDVRSGGLDVTLEAFISTEAMRDNGCVPVRLTRSSTLHMYWSIAQLIAHHTSGGCDLRSGDLLGSGTISAPDAGGYGSLLEITDGGSTPVLLPTSETRTFLQDGDEITLRARAERPGAVPIGFGDCTARVVPAPAHD